LNFLEADRLVQRHDTTTAARPRQAAKTARPDHSSTEQQAAKTARHNHGSTTTEQQATKTARPDHSSTEQQAAKTARRDHGRSGKQRRDEATERQHGGSATDQKLENGHDTIQNILQEVLSHSKFSSPARKKSREISQPRPYKDQDTIVNSTRCDKNAPMTTTQSTMTRQQSTTKSHCDKKNPGQD